MIETRRDRLHQYGYFVLAGICVVGLSVALVRGRLDRNVAVVAVGGVIAALVGWARYRERIVADDDGLEIHRLWGTRHVRWNDIASYRLRDTTDYWTPSEIFELLVWPFVLLVRYGIHRPTRWLLRRLLVRNAEDRRFLDAQLTLLDAAGKKLFSLSGEDGYAGAAALVEEVVARLHARPLPPFTISDRSGQLLDLGAISSLEVGTEDTAIATTRGSSTIATSELPNPFLVIEAVRTRGGRVTVASRVFLPRALRAALVAG